MMKQFLYSLLFVGCITPLHANDKFFSKKWVSVYQGYRNIHISKNNSGDQLDFLDYTYSVPGKSDYQYFEIATKLNRNNKYEINARLALYDNLIPYCYSFSFHFYNKHKLGIIMGSMANRFYFIDFDSYFTSNTEKPVSTRSIDRQWNFTLLSFYIGPCYNFEYKTIQLSIEIKGGLNSFIPFTQKNIIKKDQSNYKMVLNYKTSFNYSPFVMPEIELFIELFKYKKSYIGIKTKFSYLATKNAINYQRNTYEWTYENLVKKNFTLPKHLIQNTDWDLGLFVRW